MSVTEKPTALAVNGASAPAAFTLPESGAAAWGIVLVPGSFMNDIDGEYRPEHGNPFSAKPHVYRDLARQLAGLGHAALRYARGGVTVVDPDLARARRHFEDRTADVAEAVRVLRTSVPAVKRVALAGHSEGGPVSLLLMTTDRETGIDAYISLSAGVYLSIGAWKGGLGLSPGVQEFLEKVHATGNPAVTIAFGDPYVLGKIPTTPGVRPFTWV